jgi:hypothetical protein
VVYKQIIKQTADDLGLPEDKAATYIRALFDSIQASIAHYEPVNVKGLMEIRLHDYIFQYKMHGKPLPMPEGIVDKINEERVDTYNSRRKAGSYILFQKDGTFIGQVKRQIGDENLMVQPLLKVEKCKVGTRTRYRWGMVSLPQVEISKTEYKRKGSVRHWLSMVISNFEPAATVEGIMRKLKYGNIQRG